MSNIDAMAADLFSTISAYIDKRVATIVEKMAEMQTKLDAYQTIETRMAGLEESAIRNVTAVQENTAAIYQCMADEIAKIPKPKDGEPGPEGKSGAPGEKGSPGKDADTFEVTAAVLEQLKAHVADMERRVEKRVDANIVEAIKLLPTPKDGKPGENGKSVDLAEVVKSVVSLIPVPKDGEPGDHGRDSIQCDVIDMIDPERRYQRGTYAKYRGGRIRAFRATDPMGDGPLEKFGWTVDLEGVAEVGVTQGDDMRSFAVGVELTSGKSFVQKFSMPVVLDRGKFEREQSYSKGDSVSWDGSAWIAQKDIESAGDKPLPPDWRLSIKRGQDGKDLRTEEAPRAREPLRLR